MIDKYLKKEDVQSLIKEIKRNPRYFEKEKGINDFYSDIMGSELSLYILYDALIKYKIIIDDEALFYDYIIQIDKLYKKIDNYSEIIVGINKLICYMVIRLLNIKGIEEKDNKRKIIDYIYKKYIIDGYFVHGFSTVYENSIKESGFIPEVYKNYYNNFYELKSIFSKYGYDCLIEKDFTNCCTYFTDNFIMGCFYSSMSPGYYSNLLFNRVLGKCEIENYLKLDFDGSINYLKKFMISKSFDKKDIDYVLYVVKKEWDLLFRVKKKINLLFVRRNLIDCPINKIDDYLDDDSDIFDIVDRILCSKNENIEFSDVISSADLNISSIDDYYDIPIDNINKLSINNDYLPFKKNNEVVNHEFLNAYGNVYIFLLLGSIFISFGVIIMVIMILRGM